MIKNLEDLMIDIPACPSKEELPHIDTNREYFLVTTEEFMIYYKQKQCWFCLRTNLVIPCNISDVVTAKGDMHLHVPGKKITHGKYATADNMDAILDLFNSGEYLEWLASVS